MRRFTSLLRNGLFSAFAVAIYVCVRWWAVAGETASRFPDSLGYEHVTFVGTNERFWSVPLVYSFVQTSHQRVIAQVVIGTLAWVYLARRIGLISRWPRSMTVAVLALGLVPQVIHYDLAILSESLGISFAIALVAATLHLVHSPTRLAKISWLIFLTLCAFTRPTHLIVLFACALYCIGVFVFSGRKKRKVSAIVLSCLSIWGFMQLKGNESESVLNFYTVLQRRVIVDDAAYTWFIREGMPDISGIRGSHGYGQADQLDADVRAFIRLPIKQMPPMSMVAGGLPLAKWVRDHGWSTYSKYLFTHPSSARQIITQRANQSLSPKTQEFLPTDSHPLMPRNFFNPWWVWAILLFASLAFSWMSHARAVLVRALSVMTLLTLVIYFVSVLTSAIEYERHAATSAVLLRVLAIACFAAATSGRKITTPDELSDQSSSTSSRGTKKT